MRTMLPQEIVVMGDSRISGNLLLSKTEYCSTPADFVTNERTNNDQAYSGNAFGVSPENCVPLSHLLTLVRLYLWHLSLEFWTIDVQKSSWSMIVIDMQRAILHHLWCLTFSVFASHKFQSETFSSLSSISCWSAAVGMEIWSHIAYVRIVWNLSSQLGCSLCVTVVTCGQSVAVNNADPKTSNGKRHRYPLEVVNAWQILMVMMMMRDNGKADFTVLLLTYFVSYTVGVLNGCSF